MAELRDLNPGDVITAEWLNTLKARVDEALGRVGVPGGGDQAGGIARALAAIKPDEWVQCRMTAVLAPGGGVVPEWPSNVRYNVIGIGKPGIVLLNQMPTIGRPVKNDEAKIWPCPVGSICYIVRSPAADNSGGVDIELAVFHEVVARRICSGPGAVLAGASAVVRRRELDPLPLIPIPRVGTDLRAGLVTADSGKTTGGGGEAAGAGGAGDGAGDTSGPGGGAGL